MMTIVNYRGKSRESERNSKHTHLEGENIILANGQRHFDVEINLNLIIMKDRKYRIFLSPSSRNDARWVWQKGGEE